MTEATEATAEANPAVPAATVLLLRDGVDGVEVLMLRRSGEGTFADAWVFPGGKVDPEDTDPDAPDDEIAAARRAAVREAMEEAGLVLDIDDLVTYSHWLPPVSWAHRFSTWFFVAAAAEAIEVIIDGNEIHDHAWLRPADALARRDAGEFTLVPPTWVTLWQLSKASSVAAVLHDARAREPVRYATRPKKIDGIPTALWAGDEDYEGGDTAVGDTAGGDTAGARHRLVMDPTGWRFEHDL